MKSSVTRRQWQRMLLVGLCLFAALLLSAIFLAWRTVTHIEQHTQEFAAQQSIAKQSIDRIEQQQAELNSRWLKLARKKDAVPREEILAQTQANREDMGRALEAAYEQAEILRETIFQEGHGLLRWTVWIFAACVALSLLCAVWAVRASTLLFKRLEQQANDLSELQYQFLETQENTARRFSHELHDELGQALAAVKANLSALRGPAGDARVDDCMALVDGAIRDVREMSQLLRPTILDDFGLDAALRSLTAGFAQRTGIKVSYESEMDTQRLADRTETSLFRIAQEALTNVARHSKASEVEVRLSRRENAVELTIRDNGEGFDMSARRKLPGLGLAGIRTRAQGCGGSVEIVSAPGSGLKVGVICPITL
jgi:signal transduction histidine kinase